MLLSHFFNDYEAMKLAGCHRNTKLKHRIARDKLSEWLGRAAELNDLTDDTLLRFRSHLIDSGLAASTINAYVAALQAEANFAFRRGLIHQAPEIKKLREVQREPIALTLDQLSDLLSACSKQDYVISNVPACCWWKSFVLAAYETGLRCSALKSIRWADVDEKHCTLLVRGEFNKTRKDARKSVSRETMEAIQEVKRPENLVVWQWDRNPSYFWNLSRRLFSDAGLPKDARFGMHSLRRTHGTMIAAQLGDFAAADSLQHASVTTFRKHYRDDSKIDGSRLLDALPRPKAG